MKQILTRDPVARMDEIVRELSSLYLEADELIDAYVERVCLDAGIPHDIIRHHAHKKLAGMDS
jgi:hypothetical protein